MTVSVLANRLDSIVVVDNEPGGLRYAAASYGGAVDDRAHSDDAAYAGAHLLVIADGFASIGAVLSAHGIASKIAIEELRRADVLTRSSNMTASLEKGIAHLRRTYRKLHARDPLWHSGTSLTAMLWRDTHAAIAHIGSTRAYMLRSGELTQLTCDHTLGQILLDEGKISPDELGVDRNHSLLMRYLDIKLDKPADIIVHEGTLGDRYLLSTDGLHDVIPLDTLRNILRDTTRDPQDAVDDIVKAALPIGHYDDFSCIVADLVNQSGASTRPVTLLPYDTLRPRNNASV